MSIGICRHKCPAVPVPSRTGCALCGEEPLGYRPSGERCVRADGVVPRLRHLHIAQSHQQLKHACRRQLPATGSVQVSLSISTDGNEVTNTPAIKCMMCYH